MRRLTDIQRFVFDTILNLFPISKVEQTLGSKASLVSDLGLTIEQIYYLGLIIEKELQTWGLIFLTDTQILNWSTVQDIIDTVSEVVGLINHL